MSAIRGTDRRATRSLNSSPYASARPAPKKKSSWTFGIGDFLSYINPLRSRSSDVGEEETARDFDIDNKDAAESNGVPSPTDMIMRSPNGSSAFADPQILVGSPSSKAHQLANNLNGAQTTEGQAQHNPGSMFSTPPRVDSNSPTNEMNLSPAESLEKVQNFLKEKNGQALSEWETRGLLTFLEKNVQNDNEKPEPFRFSSPARTPARGNSPVFVFGTPGVSQATDGDGASPRKTLPKNPNGVYRWQGGGSARPRNRFQSPSFGTRTPPPTIKLSPAKTDTKRRRVGEDTDISSPQRVPFPAVSPEKPVTASAHCPAPAPSQARPSIFPPANGTSAAQNSGASMSSAPKTSGTTVPRLRTSGLPTKPTAPSVPSPLRQTWGQGDSPPHTPSSKPNGTPTKAANFMTELIKDVTPPKRPDVANPYQTASPVKPPTKKPVVKRSRASAKPPPAPMKTPEPSPQAIIEATLPKGSKRSRPPPDLVKSTRPDTIPATAFAPAPSRRSPGPVASDIFSINSSSSTSSDIQSTKSLPVVVDDSDRIAKKPKTTPPIESVVIVEEIEDVDMPLPSNPPVSRPTEIIEPDDDASNDQPAGPSNALFQSSTGASPIKSAFGLKSSAPKEPSKLRFSYKGDASPPLAAAVPVSTSSSFAPPTAPIISHAKLPGGAPTVPSGMGSADPKEAVIVMAVHDLPTFSFPQPVSRASSGVDHFESTLKAVEAIPGSSLPTFDFSASSAPATQNLGAPTAKGFDWAAAGMQSPATAVGTWTCSTCMLSNPATATRCTVCDASR